MKTIILFHVPQLLASLVQVNDEVFEGGVVDEGQLLEQVLVPLQLPRVVALR